MGAVRHRELIRVLSLVVALNLAIGVGTLVVRSGDRAELTTQYAGSTGIRLDTKHGSVLAGGSFNSRRDSGNSSATTAPAAAPTTAPVAPPTSAAPPPTSGPAATTPSTIAPTTATTRKPPATTATTRAAGRSTSSTTRPVPAPPVTTATGPNGAVKNGGKLGDPAGDTFVDGTQDPIAEGRADIVRSRAVYEPERITFVVQVEEPSEPTKDERWASDSTFARWEIDTNGDGAADFDVQYYIDKGTYAGAVSKPGEAQPEIVCEVGTATYGPEGYSVTIPAYCLDDPASFQYRVTMYYDTDPKNENANVASDVAPDGGLSVPISRGA
ncbi:MAG TPA: hypothetical protein VJS45_15850 [Acidimicrobiia bacterium]|nr:hypothetical protein [Acidimicrobiia bacterium]